jgi:hypothetical protein
MRPGSISLLVGEAGVGKTNLVADLLYATALSHLDTKPVTCWGGLLRADAEHLEGYRAALITNETNEDELARIIKGHCQARGHRWTSELTRTTLDGIACIEAAETGLHDPKRREQGIEDVLEILTYLEVGLVVIDPLSDVFGLREVTQPDWVVDGLRPLASRLKAAKILTVLCAHTSRLGPGKHPLGSSQQEGVADIQIAASKTFEGDLQSGVGLELVKYRADGRYWIKSGSKAALEFGPEGGGYRLLKDPAWSADPPIEITALRDMVQLSS